ncbi:MAG: hypothetical protein ACLVE2_11995, partial [Bacteroides caccae]
MAVFYKRIWRSQKREIDVKKGMRRGRNGRLSRSCLPVSSKFCHDYPMLENLFLITGTSLANP